MVSQFLFAKTPSIVFGAHQFAKLPGLFQQVSKNVLLVTGGTSFRSKPNYDYLIQGAKEKDINLLEAQIAGEPTVEEIDKICEEFRYRNIHLVCAIGGGSVLDAGKAISAMLPILESVENYLEGIGTKTHSGDKIPFYAVPTTSGTGSEATKNAVISRVGENGFKKSLRHDNFVPDLALVDPNLTLSCSPEITASCGMDAITQLIESYVSTKAGSMTDALALDGLYHAITSIKHAYFEPDRIQARSSMSYAALMSGICLTNAGLGTVHGFASSIGGMFQIPHGVVCGTLLPACIDYTIKRIIEQDPEDDSLRKFADIAMLFGDVEYTEDIDLCKSLVENMYAWVEGFKIPTLSHYGIGENDFDKIVEMTDNKNNPFALDKNDLKAILKIRL